MLNPIKQDLKHLLAEKRQEKVFASLTKGILTNESKLFNEVILLQNRWNEVRQQDIMGRIDYREKNLTFNNVNEALLYLIDRIEVEDLSHPYRRKQDEHVGISEYQSYTCNREEQYKEFLICQLPPKAKEIALHDGKVKFFYLYGEARQEIQYLFQRLRLERGGLLKNWRKGNYDPGIKTVEVDFEPECYDIAALTRMELMRDILASFLLPMEEDEKLGKCKLSLLLSSPKVKDLGAKDYVFVLVTIDDDSWDAEASPEVLRILYTDFCNCQLPEDSPSFYFFFGVEFEADNTWIREELQGAMEDARYGWPLKELSPIPKSDLYKWMKKRRVLWKGQRDPESIIDEEFPGPGPFDMRDVFPILKKIINRHNEGYIIT